MIKEEKCVEYYFDSRKYNEFEIIESMKQEEIGFEKKKSEINISLNEYGIYVVKLKFLNNKLSLIKNNIKNKTKHIKKTRKTYKGYNTYNGNNKMYGQYKTTKTYQPI